MEMMVGGKRRQEIQLGISVTQYAHTWKAMISNKHHDIGMALHLADLDAFVVMKSWIL